MSATFFALRDRPSHRLYGDNPPRVTVPAAITADIEAGLQLPTNAVIRMEPVSPIAIEGLEVRYIPAARRLVSLVQWAKVNDYAVTYSRALAGVDDGEFVFTNIYADEPRANCGALSPFTLGQMIGFEPNDMGWLNTVYGHGVEGGMEAATMHENAERFLEMRRGEIKSGSIRADGYFHLVEAVSAVCVYALRHGVDIGWR
ncbi:hypothetical protein [Magnetospirillum sp. SS-4]|uniref:hypothetical protein n=1 Tax=Magnetospirillum sp. SS-4 TaxID=2681465 RepID=UPI00137E4B06|nr:hypothetical protein [Magnetospirillum sp. SS-4]CAA7627628.1 hypothetical protein MTBSS4_90153 [Magnetospirillum sp. SS-4]